MSAKISSLLSLIDYTGIEAAQNINFKGKKIYKTGLGGFISLLAYLVILTVSLIMFGKLLGPPDYTQAVQINYIEDE